MNRREFIKSGIVGITALSSGIGVGSVLINGEQTETNFSAYSFLSSENDTIINCLSLFKNKINNNEFNKFLNYKRLDEIINKRFFVADNNFLSSKIVEIKLSKLDYPINSDIFISSNKKLVLDPKFNLTNSFLRFREQVKGKTANCLLSIEMKEKNYLSDFIYQKRKYFILENEKGIIDKISFAKNYSNILCPGKIGNTIVEISSGKIIIKKSPCRHKLCKKMSTSKNIIACVPNKILIKTV